MIRLIKSEMFINRIWIRSKNPRLQNIISLIHCSTIWIVLHIIISWSSIWKNPLVIMSSHSTKATYRLSLSMYSLFSCSSRHKISSRSSSLSPKYRNTFWILVWIIIWMAVMKMDWIIALIRNSFDCLCVFIRLINPRSISSLT